MENRKSQFLQYCPDSDSRSTILHCLVKLSWKGTFHNFILFCFNWSAVPYISIISIQFDIWMNPVSVTSDAPIQILRYIYFWCSFASRLIEFSFLNPRYFKQSFSKLISQHTNHNHTVQSFKMGGGGGVILVLNLGVIFEKQQMENNILTKRNIAWKSLENKTQFGGTLVGLKSSSFRIWGVCLFFFWGGRAKWICIISWQHQ